MQLQIGHVAINQPNVVIHTRDNPLQKVSCLDKEACSVHCVEVREWLGISSSRQLPGKIPLFLHILLNFINKLYSCPILSLAIR